MSQLLIDLVIDYIFYNQAFNSEGWGFFFLF